MPRLAVPTKREVDGKTRALFEGVDYVALGHLHGAQQPRNGRVVYSGSPLAYSFSEEHHTKSVTIVDLEQDGTVAIRQVPTPVHRPVIRLSGELEEFLNVPSLRAQRSDLCSVHLADCETPIEPMGRLRQSYDHVLELALESRLGHQHDLSYAKRLAGLSDLELSEQFIADMWGRPALPTETKLLQAGLESLRSGQESSVTGNERSINIDEGPALGVALLAGVGTGVYPSVADACKSVIKVTNTVKADPKTKKVYDGFYPIYQSLYHSVKGQFEAVSKIVA